MLFVVLGCDDSLYLAIGSVQKGQRFSEKEICRLTFRIGPSLFKYT